MSIHSLFCFPSFIILRCLQTFDFKYHWWAGDNQGVYSVSAELNYRQKRSWCYFAYVIRNICGKFLFADHDLMCMVMSSPRYWLHKSNRYAGRALEIIWNNKTQPEAFQMILNRNSLSFDSLFIAQWTRLDKFFLYCEINQSFWRPALTLPINCSLLQCRFLKW